MNVLQYTWVILHSVFFWYKFQGVPDPLRGQVWQMMAGLKENDELLEGYKHFIKKVNQCARWSLD